MKEYVKKIIKIIIFFLLGTIPELIFIFIAIYAANYGVLISDTKSSIGNLTFNNLQSTYGIVGARYFGLVASVLSILILLKYIGLNTIMLFIYISYNIIRFFLLAKYAFNSRESESDEDFIYFLTNQCKNKNGLYLSDMWNFSNEQMENTHNYIQYMFPTKEKSSYVKNSPYVKNINIYLDSNGYRQTIQQNMKKSFSKYISFLGLKIDSKNADISNENDNILIIIPANNFNERFKIWGTKNNHNFKRITRVLTSMRLFGLTRYSFALLNCLMKINKKYEFVDDKTTDYWLNACIYNKAGKAP